MVYVMNIMFSSNTVNKINSHTFGLQLHLLLATPGVVVILSNLFCH